METDILLFRCWTLAACGLYLVSSLAYLSGRERVGGGFILAGWVVNIIALVGRGHVAGTWYPSLMVVELYIIPAVMAAIVLFLFRCGRTAEGRLALVPLVVCCGITILLPVEAPLPWVKQQAVSATLFFLTEALSFALLVVAGVLAFASLVSGPSSGVSYDRMILWGFLIFTLCQISGAVWAYRGWSYPFSWSPRHLTSASLWCLYAALVHARFIEMRPRLKAMLAAFGIIPFLYMIYHHQLIELLKMISSEST